MRQHGPLQRPEACKQAAHPFFPAEAGSGEKGRGDADTFLVAILEVESGAHFDFDDRGGQFLQRHG